jgi:hypothetical protein
MKNLKTIFIALTLSYFNTAISADCLSTIDEHKIYQAIKDINVSYGDVKPLITMSNCDKPANKAENLICHNSKLLLMQEFDTKAYVYAYENATHQEVNHKKVFKDTKWIKNTRDKCQDESCLCEVFKNHTNDSRGSESPYDSEYGK